MPQLEPPPSRPRRILTEVLSSVAMGIAVVGIVGALSTVFLNRTPEPSTTEIWAEVQSSAAQIATLKDAVSIIETQLANFRKMPEDSPEAVQILALQGKLTELEKRYAIIEQALEDSPERAMSIPLMRRDIDALKGELSSSQLSFKEEIQRVYDLNKWFIGGIAVSVVGLILHSLFGAFLAGRRQ